MWISFGFVVVALFLIAVFTGVIRFYKTRETPRDRELQSDPASRRETGDSSQSESQFTQV